MVIFLYIYIYLRYISKIYFFLRNRFCFIIIILEKIITED